MRFALLSLVLLACGREPAAPVTKVTMTFEDDVTFLRQHGDVLVLKSDDGGAIAISPLYQGRVMTSAVAASAPSLGWINRSFIGAGKTGTPFDNYGGEDRFWLGPEGGQFGLYFSPGAPFTFDTWQTPHALQEGAWEVSERADDHVVFKKRITVTNWSETEFTVDVERTLRVLGRADIAKVLGVAPTNVRSVAYASENTITNAGTSAWTKAAGLPSIWILAMFAPAADARILVPFESGEGEVVNDRYFGKVPPERLVVDREHGYLSFVADGKVRGKIGLGPGRAKNVLGSYSAAGQLLTIVHYDGVTKGAPYVNSMWEQQKDPYAGDVVNSYNDGPPAPGKPPLGGFYELETSSAAAELAPGKSMTHVHRTLHFVGAHDALAPLASRVLGIRI